MEKCEFTVEILEDGTAKISSDKIPEELHEIADELLDFFEGGMGTKRQTEQRRAGHRHVHIKDGQQQTHQH